MIKRIAAERWGIKYHVQKVLYGAIALPIVKYGAVLWYDVVSKVTVKRNIWALQRALLLLMTKACRTTSTAAMQIIAGAKPLDLEVVEDALLKRIKRNLTTTWESYHYMEKGDEQFHELLSEEIERIRSYITSKWQSAWRHETHGRETYEFIPDVTFAIRNRSWFAPSRLVTYLITGYGPINYTLHKRGLSDISGCPICDECNETTDHIIFNCVGYQNYRWTEFPEHRDQKQKLIQDKDTLEKFNNFAKNVFERRSITM